jgi:glycosyltransferase involved in cell wall biosynthesis
MNIKVQIKKYIFLIIGYIEYLVFVFKSAKKIKNAEYVFFFPYYHTGGAERVHISILNALKYKNCVVIFTLGSATKNFYSDFNNIATLVELNPVLNKKNDFINKVLERKIIRIINASTSIKTIFGSNSAYYYCILPYIKKTIKKLDLFHAFEAIDLRNDSILESSNFIDSRVVITQNAKDYIHKLYDTNGILPEYFQKIQVIQNGIILPKTSLAKTNNKIFKIGFVGRWSPEKRPELFLEIAEKSKGKNYNFVMAGSGMNSYKAKILKSGVQFLGEIQHSNDLENLYSSLDVLIICSVYEGFPVVVMESMSYGVIPVSTNVGGISEHITSDKNGVLINKSTETDIVKDCIEKLNRISQNENYKIDLSKNAKEYAMLHFGLESFNRSYQALFNS